MIERSEPESPLRRGGADVSLCVETPRDEMGCRRWDLATHDGWRHAAARVLGLDPSTGRLYGEPFDAVRMHAIDDLSWSMRRAREANVCRVSP